MKKVLTFWLTTAQVIALALGLATVGLSLVGLSMAGHNSAHAQSVDANRFEGILSVVWGDPRSGSSGGETRFNLTLSDGTAYRLNIDAGQQNAAIGYFGKRVEVQGSAAEISGVGQSISVNEINLAEAPAIVERQEAVSGTRRILYLLLRYAGDSQEPHTPDFYLDLTNPKTPPQGSNIPGTLNGFFHKTSARGLKWKADVGGIGGLNPSHWLKLPHSKSYYANCGWTGSCANLDAIVSDGMALAVNAGIDLTVYDNINFVLNNDLDCCAWGGGDVYDGQFYGMTWEPPWGQETGTYTHEFGHSIGLPHSGWSYYAYDSPWDMMSGRTSAQSILCGSYFSNNDNADRSVYCTEPGNGYIAAHKEYLGWIPAENLVVVDSVTKVKVKLQPSAFHLRSGIKMIKVCLKGEPCSGSKAHYLTVEARAGGYGSKSNYDNKLPGAGVIIHDFRANRAPIGAGNPCFTNTQSGWAVPIDATPGDYNGSPNCNSGGRPSSDYALHNAQYLPGMRYKGSGNHIKIKVLRQAGSSYVVKVIRTK